MSSLHSATMVSDNAIKSPLPMHHVCLIALIPCVLAVLVVTHVFTHYVELFVEQRSVVCFIALV